MNCFTMVHLSAISRLTADYIHLVLQNDEGELYCCNLDLYFKENSLLLNKLQGAAPNS